MTVSTWSRASALALTLALLGGCGGGGSGGTGVGVVSSPTPTTPTPQPANMFAAPATQQFTTLMVPTQGSDVEVSYDAATKLYSVSLNGGPNQPLTFWTSVKIGNIVYDIGAADSGHKLLIDYASWAAHQYTRLGAYYSAAGYEHFVLGTDTPLGAVPTTGTATFNGSIAGRSDAIAYSGDVAFMHGSIQLAFDFAGGSLSGSIHPVVEWSGAMDGGVQDLGNIAFTGTSFAVGSTSFGGQFDTALAGTNSFSGRFTGPAAQELMGQFSLPFTWSSAPAAGGDGNLHQAWGVMIAKR